MMLIKFLLFDLILFIIGIPLLLTFVSDKGKLDFDLTKKKGESHSALNLPSRDDLLSFEKLARKKGSGIEFGSLIGIWKFISVWQKGTDNKDSISSSLLRYFSATLELKQNDSKCEILNYQIINSIQFGTMFIRFVGYGELMGDQPLLPFYFERIELKISGKTIFSRSLEIPEINNRPFFGLIALRNNGKYLAARGRGGGLALWVKDFSVDN